MVEVLSEVEGEPANRPDMSPVLTTETGFLEPSMWERIEAWITHRWGERTVTWVVQGPGTWEPRLQPATVDTAEVWDGGQWVTTTLDPAPVGYELDVKAYRITATVGTTDDPPHALDEAFRRLAEYIVDDSYLGRVATSGSRDLGDVSINSERPTAWLAKALHHSGAADLLRRYR